MEISDILIAWFEEHKRDLPWRHSTDPYIIWISEIILQQTRVVQGMDYFLRFTNRFPDVRTLAEADDDEVMKYWQGLGYYSRARNLHTAARQIMDKYDGKFPTEYADILALRGIGEYTAAAIASFAWNKPYPVVDGNVYRVLSRLFAVATPIDSTKGKKEFADLAAAVMNPAKAGAHNQAIMEFGALHCTPLNPSCLFCPLQSKCLAFAKGSPTDFPVKQNKTKTRDRYFHYFHLIYKGKTWLHRRSTKKDIWRGLYEFPMIETDRPAALEELLKLTAFQHIFGTAESMHIDVKLKNVKHVLSHQTLYATFYKVSLSSLPKSTAWIEIDNDEIGNYPVPRLIEIYLEKAT